MFHQCHLKRPGKEVKEKERQEQIQGSYANILALAKDVTL